MRPERALLSEIVDYAGLFPPAQLPLEKAVREYAAHLGEEKAWMLGRFIIPAQRLEELEPHLVIFSEPLRIIVLGKGGRSEDEYLKNLNQDKSIKGVWITIETFDCKKGCKNCITANIATYNVLEENNPFTDKTHNTLRPNNTFQVNFNFEDATLKRTYVQASGNVTCYASSIDKVKGFHVFE